METRDVDVAIIGAGTAGLNAVREAEKSGRSWLLIEQGPYGTLCARVGCMPSKLLIAAADAAHRARSAATFGIETRVQVNGPAVLERLRRERDGFAGAVVKDTEALPSRNRLKGRARFLDATTLEVTPQQDGHDPATRVHAGATVVATGSSPVIPGMFRSVRSGVLTTDDVFELAALPRSLAVVGTGIVGLELGQAMTRLGVDVTFLDRSAHPGPCTDPEVRRAVLDTLGAELNLNMNATVTGARNTSGSVSLAWHAPSANPQTGEFDAVLLAAGRAPNLADLDLQATGLALDERGMPAWNPDTGQCADLPVFLAGDVNGYRPLLHEAGDEGRIAGANAAAWPHVVDHDRRTALAVVFSDPQMAMVGTPFADLDLEAVAIGQASFDQQGRARVMAVNQGTLRVYARRDDCRLVGAELFGPEIEHLAHTLAWAVQEGTPVQQLLQMPVYHPTLEEGMRSALRDLARRLEVEGDCRHHDRTTSPGM